MELRESWTSHFKKKQIGQERGAKADTYRVRTGHTRLDGKNRCRWCRQLWGPVLEFSLALELGPRLGRETSKAGARAGW